MSVSIAASVEPAGVPLVVGLIDVDTTTGERFRCVKTR